MPVCSPNSLTGVYSMPMHPFLSPIVACDTRHRDIIFAINTKRDLVTVQTFFVHLVEYCNLWTTATNELSNLENYHVLYAT